MPMKLKRWNNVEGLNETWLHHKWRELCSGSFTGRRWYHELALWFIHSGRSVNYKLGALHLKLHPNFPWEDKYLTYAGTARCTYCGAGLACHLGVGPRGSWECSDVLTGRVDRAQARKHDSYPFTFYEIKSENQPSQHGATTRPGVKKVIHGGFRTIFKR